MPRFFLPGLEDNPELAEETYGAIKLFARDKTLWRIQPDRIYSLGYRRDGEEFQVAVGRAEPRTGERVIAILRSEAYLVCTATHGGVGGPPLIVHFGDVFARQDFDAEDPGSPSSPSFAYETLARAIATLDSPSDNPGERLLEAAWPLIGLNLDDFPPLLAADFLSLLHRLTWRQAQDGESSLRKTVSQMTDEEVDAAARSLHALFNAIQP
ncbi:MAG: hypothetical protein GEU75_01930 [Dehalococcoidia bacterium]|nr:hypothetical protein [Dehalococcoidia bacterium]